MESLAGKRVLVIGMGVSGLAASRLLLAQGADVTAVDGTESDRLRAFTQPLIDAGAKVQLGINGKLPGGFDLAVVSPGVPLNQPLLENLHADGVPVIGELELGWQNSLCLNIAVTGTNGKTTTVELVRLCRGLIGAAV